MAAEADTKPGPLIGPVQRSENWMNLRRQIITATDAAAICGISPWKTPLAVFMEKTGRTQWSGNHFTKRGQQFEPLIAQDYADETGVPLGRYDRMYLSRENVWIGASPDWYRTCDNGTVETKWTSQHKDLGEDYSDVVPEDWLMQVQVQMYVMEQDRAEIAAWVGPALRLRIFRVERNDQLINLFLEAAQDMRENILHDQPPEPDWQHPSTLGLIKEIFGVEELTVDMGEQGAILADLYERYSEEIGKLQADRDAIQSKILHLMGHAAIGRFPGGKEFVRHSIKETNVSYVRKPYTSLRLRKAKTQ